VLCIQNARELQIGGAIKEAGIEDHRGDVQLALELF
jgi:hypothetical protein